MNHQTTPESELVAIGLGSNLGNRVHHLRQGLQALQQLGNDLRASDFYETDPLECSDPRPFLNAVATMHTSLEPQALLEALLAVEDLLGRRRPFPNAPRTLDLDLLFFGNRAIQSPQLSLPHPRWQKRRFVVDPLSTLCGKDFPCPPEGKPLGAIAATLHRKTTQKTPRWFASAWDSAPGAALLSSPEDIRFDPESLIK
jgi:2-amino-4-hydroxy-6-hydroxymethyldihydropteridine diphosphokinase